jgi:hypothetical protein
MDIAEMDQELGRLHGEYMSKFPEWRSLFGEYMELEYDDPRRILLFDQLREHERYLKELEKRIDALQGGIREYRSPYRRPDGLVSGCTSWLLPPLPEGLRAYKVTDEIIDIMPRFRGLPLVLTAGVACIFVAATFYLPWLLVSPVVTATEHMGVPASRWSGTVSNIVATATIVVVTLALLNRRFTRRMIYDKVMYEEQRFRSGAEHWTVWQRAMSCVVFGMSNILNLIFPLVTIVVLTGLGVVLVQVYLREYQRSGNTYRAALASVRFHAMCTSYGLAMLCMAGMLQVVLSSA